MEQIREAACAVLLRPAQNTCGYDVYLARRSRELAFLGGFDVFPGGTVDPRDETTPTNLEDDDLRAHRSACARELFEETGVLALDRAPDIPRGERDRVRRALVEAHREHTPPLVWDDMLERHGAKVDGQALISIGHWITPPYLPTLFSARYFVFWKPSQESAEVWPGELAHGDWFNPEAAIAAHNRGSLFISYPVLETLRAMIRHGSDLDAAVGELCERAATHPISGAELFRGVHVCPIRTFTLPPATHTNCYILGDREIVVVDPASPIAEEQEKLIGYLHHLQASGGKLREIWLTHHHKDHVGAVARIRNVFNIPVAAHPVTRRALNGDIPTDRDIHDGDVARLEFSEGKDAEWIALHTPGHAAGHLCFYERHLKTLISGDNVLGIGTVLIAPPEGNMAEYLDSLRRLYALDIGFLMPAHGPPVASAKEKIAFYMTHRLARERSIHAAIADQGLAVRSIVEHVYRDTDPRAFPLADLNVRAHLEKLIHEGLVVVDDDIFQTVKPLPSTASLT